jgi:hypothetical protein
MLTNLDHIGTAVEDLGRAKETFTRLGFRLTGISHHEGAVEPGQPVQPWGSANHCAMLKHGYLELLGITNPALFNPVVFMLQRYAGPHIVAFSSKDADADYEALKQRSTFVMPPRDLGRLAPYGAGGEEMRRVSFKLVGVERGHLPEARFQLTEHLTPYEMWQPWLLEHPNGAVALRSAHLVTEDPAKSAADLAHFLGVSVERTGEDTSTVQLERSALHYHGVQSWEAFAGRPLKKPIPAVAGIGIQVMSIDRTANALRSSQINFDYSRSQLRVAADFACGAELIFGE